MTGSRMINISAIMRATVPLRSGFAKIPQSLMRLMARLSSSAASLSRLAPYWQRVVPSRSCLLCPTSNNVGAPAPTRAAVFELLADRAARQVKRAWSTGTRFAMRDPALSKSPAMSTHRTRGRVALRGCSYISPRCPPARWRTGGTYILSLARPKMRSLISPSASSRLARATSAGRGSRLFVMPRGALPCASAFWTAVEPDSASASMAEPDVPSPLPYRRFACAMRVPFEKPRNLGAESTHLPVVGRWGQCQIPLAWSRMPSTSTDCNFIA